MSDDEVRRWGRVCLVCGERMISDAVYNEMTLLDDREKCETGCKRYGEHFTRGKYEVAVKQDDEWITFMWLFNDTSKHKQGINDDIDELVQTVKKDWENEHDSGTAS